MHAFAPKVTSRVLAVDQAAPGWHGRGVRPFRLLLVARRHVDLGRLASALCPVR
jgi:hypothetical protein